MKLESIDLNLLLVFDALSTERSVTQAATKVGLSQPALSNALARLRSLLGDPLFERSAGRMQPTPRARQLLVPLSEVISKLRETLETQAAFRPEESKREFLIATNDYVESLLFAPIIERLQEDAPSIAVRTVRTDYLFIPPIERMQSGEVDLALGFFGDMPQPQSGILSQRLIDDRLVCILRASHPRAKRKLTLRTFAETPHVRVMYPQNEHVGSIDPILRSRGLSRRIAVTVPHYLTIPAIVAKSNLIGVVPEQLAWREARALRLRIFEPPIALPDITIVMTWHERLQFDRAHSWFRDCVGAVATSKSLSASSGERGPKRATSRTRPARPRKA